MTDHKYTVQHNYRSISKIMSKNKKIKSKDELVILGSPIGGGLRPIAISNTLRRIVSKHAGSKALAVGSFQVGCGTKRGAEIAAHSYRKLIERADNRKRSVLLKKDFTKAIILLKRETMLNQVFSDSPKLYKYTHCAYSKPSYLYFMENPSLSRRTEHNKVIPRLQTFLRK